MKGYRPINKMGFLEFEEFTDGMFVGGARSTGTHVIVKFEFWIENWEVNA